MTNTEIILLTSMIVIILFLMILIIILIKGKKYPSNEIKARQQQEILSKIEYLKTDFKSALDKQNMQSQLELERTINYFKEAISTKINVDLQSMNDKVETRLKEGFQSSDKLFSSMLEKLTIIDTTQKNIENLSVHVNDLKTYLSDKKLRGMYGELQLYQILENVFGENNKTLFTKQHKLSNQTVVDAIVYGSGDALNIPIDSKFSLENYIRMYDSNSTDSERKKCIETL